MTDLKAPFPYFGGKSRIAQEVWERFGEVRNYVEPFAGSLAMLLKAPRVAPIETVNDLDGLLVNFWRSVQADPVETAKWADNPVFEADLHARHKWLVGERESLARQLMDDPDFYSPKHAGWWVWGISCWIGSGWCERLTEQLPFLRGRGQGSVATSRRMPSYGGRNTKGLVALQRTEKKRIAIGDTAKARGVMGVNYAIEYEFQRLQARLKDVRIVNGSWDRVLSPSVTHIQGLTAIFLDPPYTVGKMDYAVGGVGGALADEVREYCKTVGDNPLMRVALCGHDGEHDELLELGWTKIGWKSNGMAKTEEAKARAESETVWFSPHCLDAMQGSLF